MRGHINSVGVDSGVALTKTLAAGYFPSLMSIPLKKYSSFMSAPFGDGCVGASIVSRERADASC